MLIEGILLLTLQSLFVGVTLLAAYELRRSLGIGVFLLIVGCIKILHVFISKSFLFEIFPGHPFSIGSSVLFTAILFSILMITITEGLLKSRHFIYGLILLTVFAFLSLKGIQLSANSSSALVHNPTQLSLYSIQFNFLIFSIVILLFDSVFIYFFYENISKIITNIYAKIGLSILLVVIAHVLLFNLLHFDGLAIYSTHVFYGILNKMIPILVFTLLFSAYIQWSLQGQSNDFSTGNLFKTFSFMLYIKGSDELEKEKQVLYEKLIESEEKFRTSFKTSPDSININRLEDGMYVEINDGFTQITGFTEDEVVGKTSLEIDIWANPSDRARLVSELKSYGFAHNFQADFKSKNGRIIKGLMSANIIKLQGIPHILSFTRDISHIYENEEALRRSESLLRLSTTFGRVAVWEYNMQSGIISRSENHDELYGIKEDGDLKMNQILEKIHPKYRKIFIEMLNDSRPPSSDNTFSFSFRVINQNEKELWLNTRGVIEYDEIQNPISVHGVVIDITKQKVIEEELKEQKNFLELLINHLPNQVFWKDTNSVFQGANKVFAQVVGLNSPQEVVGKTDFDFNRDNAFSEGYREWDQRIIKSGNPVLNIPEEYIDSDGNTGEILTSKIPIKDHDDEVLGVLGICVDITAQNEAFRKLQESEYKFASLMQQAPFVVEIYDINGLQIEVNKAYETLWGFPASTTVNKFNVLKSKEVEDTGLIHYVRKAYAGEIAKVPEYEFNPKGKTEADGLGRNRWLSTTIYPLRNANKEVTHIVITHEDVTLKKEFQQEISQSNKKYKDLFEYSPIPLWEEDFTQVAESFAALRAQGVDDLEKYMEDNPEYIFTLSRAVEVLNINKQVLHLHRAKSKEEIIGHLDQIFTESSYDAFKGEMIALFRGRTNFETEGVVRTIDGEPRNIYISMHINPNFSTKPFTATIATLDITEKTKQEAELKKYNQRLENLHNIDKSILMNKSPFEIVDELFAVLKDLIPYQFATLVDYDEDKDAIKRWASLPTMNDHEAANDFVSLDEFPYIDMALLKQNKHQLISDLKQLRPLHKDLNALIEKGINAMLILPLWADNQLLGSLNIATNNGEVFHKENIKIAREVVDHLSIAIHQYQLNEALILHSENLEEIVQERTEQLEYSNKELREFAQVVSHDLKAPLRAIGQLSYWISEDYKDLLDIEGQTQLALLVSRVKRMDDLIEGILQYSRAGKSRQNEVEVDLNALVEGIISSLNAPKNIRIKILNQLPNYICDSTRMGHLFQNLIDNAIKYNDKDQGIITISVDKRVEDYLFCVADNGPGIDSKYHDRIFQIFQRLSSRDESEGTGIGLSLVKRIVQIYGGEIWLESELNKGSKFYFSLPIDNQITLRDE